MTSMKTHIIYFISFCGLAMASCSLDRDYQNGPSAGTFPASKKEVQAGVFATYIKLNDFNASTTPFPLIMDNISDIAAARIGTINYTTAHLLHSLSANNELTTKWYTASYQLAVRANLVLDNIDKVRNQMTEEEYETYKGELLFTRDYVYEMMCEEFGAIPFIDHVLKVTDTYKRMSRDSVINKILDEDLTDDMIDKMTLRHSKELYGTARIGRVTAYALKARFCLNWGRYSDAAKYADNALTLAKEAGYSLTPYDTTYCGADYTKGEPSASNLFGISGEKANDEVLWALQYNSAIQDNSHNAGYYLAPRLAGGCSYWSPAQIFIDAFQCKDGLSIADSPLYDYTNPWKNRDPRLDLFCVRPGSRILGFQFDLKPTTKKIYNYNDSKDGTLVANSEAYGTKSEYGANGSKGPSGYLWRKYTDINEFKANTTYGTKSICILNIPLIRLAEVYLIRAEANIEMNTNLTQAQDDINMIRTRAKMPSITVTDQKGLRKALRYERMVELCDEGLRWFDLRRWGLANEHLNGVFYAPAFDGSVSNGIPIIDDNWHITYSNNMTWNGKPLNLRTFITMTYSPDKDSIWPIPQDEITANPLITQNPRY